MIHHLAVVLFLLSNTPADSPGAVAPSVDPAGSCKACHADVLAEREPGTDVHADMECAECHPGRSFNPHVPPDVDEEVLEAAKALEPFAETSPVALVACNDCHEEVVDAWRESIHGSADGNLAGHKHPSCTACHGGIHNVIADDEKRTAMTERCVGCHGFAGDGKVPTSEYVVDTYRHTIHGKMIQLGNMRAAACVDCHGGHDIFAIADERSKMHVDKRPETCGACHENADASFVGSISHKPHTLDEDFWGWMTALGFSVLTVGTIFLLFLHVLLDFLRAGRTAMGKREDEHQEHSTDGVVKADAELPRFDIHMRMQHWGMLSTFTILVFTGWPLKAASVGASSVIADLFGGQAMMALIHRVAGGLLLVVSVYHLVYLMWRFKQGTLQLSMLPGPKDIKDAVGNIMYFLGMREERPKFGRWTYYEKFDYWAVFWGMFIMGGSGLVLWFPVLASKFVPGELVTLTFIAHSDEALLAALAIFLWHFYNVHLRPSVFPMSWVWLNGTIPAEALYEEHREEWERLYGKKPPAAPDVAPSWHMRSIWSGAAVVVILLAGAGVVAGNVASVRDQIFAGGHGGEAHADDGHAPGASDQAKVVSAFDDEFNAFDRCFACHNEARYKEGGAGFPHEAHFEEQDVDRDCSSCHQDEWHKAMEVSTEQCTECHEPEEIGLPPAP